MDKIEKLKELNVLLESGVINQSEFNNLKKHILDGINDTNLDCTSNSKLNSVKIGKQIWTKENLNVDKFCNGEYIPHAKSTDEWLEVGKNKEAAWCYYNSLESNGTKYGKLYNWYAVIDPRVLAPKGWHIPSNREWIELENFLGDQNYAGKKIKSSTGWKDGINATNESGFCGLPGGYRHNDGLFYHIGEFGWWWSSSQSEWKTDFAMFRNAYCKLDSLNDNFDGMFKEVGLSVRCIRN